MEWVKKLSDLHRAHPSEREKMSEHEIDSFCDLVVVASFIHDLSSVVPLPQFSRKDGQAFAARSQTLAAAMNELREKVDLRAFVVPIDNLLEPGEAAGALKTLDSFIVENAKAKMGMLYYDMVDDCIVNVEERYKVAKANAEQKKKDVAAAPAPAFPSTPKPAAKMEQTAKKQKTRSHGAAAYDMVPSTEPAEPITTPTPSQTFDVSASTAEVFATFFDKSQSRGGVTWPSFESAMAELGFSVVPRFGSVYTFFPSGDMVAKRPITVHRPHGGQHGAWIEGHKLLIIARRLARVYGWGLETFRVK